MSWCWPTPAHVKNVPGRKTDVNDAIWMADLLAHGLIRASFVPPVPVQELRSLTRTRKQFVRERSAHVQRIEKVLEDANLKLAVVLSDIVGPSGRAVLQAIIDGQDDPHHLASLVSVRVKAARSEVLEALRGHISAHHRFMLKLHLDHIKILDAAINAIEQEVGRGLEPFRKAAKLLSTIPGLSTVSAHLVVAEIGIDMARFATPAHLRSWSCLCPRNDQAPATPQHPLAPRRQLAENHPGASCVGRHQGQRQLPASAVPSHQCSPRRQEGHHRRRRFHAHRHLAHAARRHRVE